MSQRAPIEDEERPRAVPCYGETSSRVDPPRNQSVAAVRGLMKIARNRRIKIGIHRGRRTGGTVPVLDRHQRLGRSSSQHPDGPTMRRYVLLIAVVLIVSCWTLPARAQFGLPQPADPNAEIEAARSKVKQDRSRYAKSAPASGARRSSVGGGFLD